MAANIVPIRRTRTRGLRGLAVFGSALIALTMVAGPASATIIERGRFSQDYEFDAWDCGYEMHVVGTESHLFQVRADKKLDGNALFTDNYQVTETWTAADGRWFTLSANGVFKDIKAKSLGGSVYEFTFHDVGQPFVITDSTGTVVSRDRGNITGHFTIDFESGSENFELDDQRAAPDVRCRSVQGRRTAHRRGLGTLSDAMADRLDRFPDGLLRVPAAELHRDRR